MVKALARSLSVPHHADAAVAGLGVFLSPGKISPFALSHLPRGSGRHTGANRLLHCRIHRVVLVVACHFLDEDAPAHILEDDEVPDQVQEPSLLEHALQNNLKLGQPVVCQFFAFNSPPGHEALSVSRQRAYAGLHTVRDHQGFVVGEQRWESAAL
jgi:hypothetical protein